MPRDANGNYTSPNSPVVAGTTVQAAYENSNTQDQATELTDSLSRSGKGPMLEALKLADAGHIFEAEQTSGIRRVGSGDVRAQVLGTDVMQFMQTAIQSYVQQLLADVGVGFQSEPTSGLSRAAAGDVRLKALGNEIARTGPTTQTLEAWDAYQSKWRGLVPGFVSAKDYGATGNGTTDDAAALLAADGAESGVFLPPGRYRIESTITLTKTWFICAGAILEPTGSGIRVTFSGAGNIIAGRYDITGGTREIRGLKQTIFPEWFGAADGQDSSNALLRACYAGYPSAISFVEFAAGNYTIGDVSIDINVRVRGAGARGIAGNQTTFSLKTGSAYVMRVGAVLDAGYVPSNQKTGGFIERIAFDGGNQTAKLLVVEGYSHFRVHENTFQNCQGVGLSFQVVMETRADFNFFRQCGAPGGGAFELQSYHLSSENNCNNIHFDHNTMGFLSGSHIWTATDANIDGIWINNNKCEHDGTPTWANPSSTPALNLQDVSRAWVMDNIFTNFTAARNNYDTVIFTSGGGGTTLIRGNLVRGCDGTFIKTGGSATVRAHDNPVIQISTSLANDIAGSGDAELQDQTGFVQRQVNGGLARVDTTYDLGLNRFIEASLIGSAIRHPIIKDAESLTKYGTVKNIVSGTTFEEYASIRPRLFVGYPGGTTLTVYMRVKAPSADSRHSFYIDDTEIAGQNILVADGWHYKACSFTLSQITSSVNNLRWLRTNANPILFDGMILQIT